MTVRWYGQDTDFPYVTLTLKIWPWVKVITHPWVMDTNCKRYYPNQTVLTAQQWVTCMVWTGIMAMCVVWPWPWRYDLISWSWRSFRPWTTIVWNITLIQHDSQKLWPGHLLSLCVHCYLDLDMTLVQSHDTSVDYGLVTTIEWNIILIQHYNTVVSYSLDNVWSVAFTLEIWLWFKIMTHSWVLDYIEYSVKYYSNPTWQ